MDIDNDYLDNIDVNNILIPSIYQCIFVPLLIYIISKIIYCFNNRID